VTGFPSDADRRALAERLNRHPGMLHLGARIDLSGPDGQVRATVDPIETHHRGGLGTEAVNGVVIAGIFDLVIGITGYLHVFGRRAGVAQLNVQYLRPVTGDRFDVVGHPTRVGQNLVFAAARLEDGQGRVCARCDGIVAVSSSAHGPAAEEFAL
jgi:uncharacterized protein (TIGR00369 family)